MLDLTDRKIGNLTIVEQTKQQRGSRVTHYCVCRCNVCGQTVTVKRDLLFTGYYHCK